MKLTFAIRPIKLRMSAPYLPADNNCDPVTWDLRNSDGDLLLSGTAPAGSTLPIIAPDAKLTFTGSTDEVFVPSKNTYNIDSAGIIIEQIGFEEGALPGEKFLILLKDADGNLIPNGFFSSSQVGFILNILIQSTQVLINGVNQLDLLASLGGVRIDLKDPDGNLVTPDSIESNGVDGLTVHLTASGDPVMTVDFTSDVVELFVGETAQFTALVTGVAATDYCWRIGDDALYIANPQFTADWPAMKNVRLMAAASDTVGGVKYRAAYLAVKGIIDQFPTGNFMSTGVGLQKLSHELSNIVLVERADTVTQGFLAANGRLSKEQLEAFSNGAKCNIREWYMNDGTGRKFVQTTWDNQLEIVDAAGNCRVANNGLPAPYFDGVNSFMEMDWFNYWGAGTFNQLYACIAVQSEDYAMTAGIIVSHFNGQTNNRAYTIGYSASTPQGFGAYFASDGAGSNRQITRRTNGAVGATVGVTEVYGVQINGNELGADRVKVWRNLTELPTVAENVGNVSTIHKPASPAKLVLGGQISGSGTFIGAFKGYLQMCSLWTGVQANRATIETNAVNQFGV